MTRLGLAAFTLSLWLLPAMAQEAPQHSDAVADVVELKGTVAAARESAIAPRFDGLLGKIHFMPGQVVDKGALLFEFETVAKKLGLDRARAGLLRAEAQLRMAELTWKNQQALRARNVTPEKQLFDAEAAKDMAQAAVMDARAQVEGAEIALSETKLYAPFAGVMGRSFVREGTYITQSAREDSKLAVITQLDPILVIADVPYDVVRSRRGLRKTEPGYLKRFTVSLVLPNGERFPHEGKIIGGGYAFDPETQMLKTLVEFPNPDFLLRPGLEVTLLSGVRPEERMSQSQ
ncbi:efflux RND transporter periplasmic adaptor subunit [Methylobacterium sp. P31]